MYLDGQAMPDRTARGEGIVDDSFLVVFNASPELETVTLPPMEWGPWWVVDVDTAEAPDSRREPSTVAVYAGGEKIMRPARSLVVLRLSTSPNDKRESEVS